MPPIPPEYKFWLDLLQWLVTGLIAATVWLRKPGEDASQAVAALRDDTHESIGKLRSDVTKQFGTLMHRVIVVEERIKHSPTSEELAELEGSVKTIGAQIAAQAEASKTMSATLSRIENYLLTRKDT